MECSRIQIKLGERVKDDAVLRFADILIDGESLYGKFCNKGYDYVVTLGWGSEEFQRCSIQQLKLQEPSELQDSRYPILVCPLCADLGCGAITARIEKNGDEVSWSDFQEEDNLGLLDVKKFDIAPIYFCLDEYERAIESTYGIVGFGWLD